MDSVLLAEVKGKGKFEEIVEQKKSQHEPKIEEQLESQFEVGSGSTIRNLATSPPSSTNPFSLDLVDMSIIIDDKIGCSMDGSMAVHAALIKFKSQPTFSSCSVMITQISKDNSQYLAWLVYQNKKFFSTFPQDEPSEETEALDILLRVQTTFFHGVFYFVVFARVIKASLRSLSIRLYPHGFPETAIIEVLHKILKALSFIHNKADFINRVHRKISAGHIFIDSDGNLKLGYEATVYDFLDESYPEEDTSSDWNSIEDLNSLDKDEPTADIWLLGILALELAYGSSTFKEDGIRMRSHKIKSIVRNICRTKRLPEKRLICKEFIPENLNFSEDFEKLVVECLTKDIRKRPSSKSLLRKRIFTRHPRTSFFYDLINDGVGLMDDLSIIYGGKTWEKPPTGLKLNIKGSVSKGSNKGYMVVGGILRVRHRRYGLYVSCYSKKISQENSVLSTPLAELLAFEESLKLLGEYVDPVVLTIETESEHVQRLVINGDVDGHPWGVHITACRDFLEKRPHIQTQWTLVKKEGNKCACHMARLGHKMNANEDKPFPSPPEDLMLLIDDDNGLS